MKAAVYEKYGLPEVLKVKEIGQPKPEDDEVLIKVRAASVNSWDWDRLTGKPFIYRLISGIYDPKLKILGADIAGEAEAVGKSVKRIKPGDHLYGDLSAGNWGGFAEYVCAKEDMLEFKPSSMTFEAAAAIPQAGVMALQSLLEKRRIRSGERLLVNGGGGGVGTFAIQMAKSFGAEVTGVDSTAKLGLMRSVGADHVIDYTKENFTKNKEQYDRIVDVVANQSVFDYRRALSNNGIYVMIGGKIFSILQAGLLGPLISGKRGWQIGLLTHKPNKDLAYINELFEAGKVKPIVDKCYQLADLPEALHRIGTGKVMGKIIIRPWQE
ncbi:MAG: NAD(P)-dependent alcohol dehydrogenase [Cytophagales bacterium]|nr:NAD(P)-dependent alcohol dehydrogenase [Cytophagales bacterium]